MTKAGRPPADDPLGFLVWVRVNAETDKGIRRLVTVIGQDRPTILRGILKAGIPALEKRYADWLAKREQRGTR